MRRVVCIGRLDLSPTDVGHLQSIGRRTVAAGDLLVSGNAPGADQAYALGGNMENPSLVELCLPWASFEKRWIMEQPDHTYGGGSNVLEGNRIRLAENATYDHLHLANDAHPIFSKLSRGAQKLLVRNAMMLIDDDGVVSSQVIAMPNREKQGWGGTGHTMRCAFSLQIPVWLVDTSSWWDGVTG